MDKREAMVWVDRVRRAVRDARMERDLSARELAVRAELHYTTLYCFERGSRDVRGTYKRSLSIDMLYRIARAMDMAPEELMR